jgi:hypothetical protein
MIAANNSWVIAFDTLSRLQPWISDTLCRLSTGGGFGARELYSDLEECIIDAQRPIVLNAIEDIASRFDLIDRAIIIDLPQIQEVNRRTEEVFWSEFEKDRPLIFGALLNVLSAAIAECRKVRLSSSPRMADFSQFGTAVERVLEWPEGSFLQAYHANRKGVVDANLEGNSIYQALQVVISGPWQGTARKLLETLKRPTDCPEEHWPRTPRALAGRLRRIAPALRMLGWLVEFDDSDHAKGRIIKLEGGGTQPSGQSAPSATRENKGSARTVADDTTDDYGRYNGRSGVPKTPIPDGTDGTDGSEPQYSCDDLELDFADEIPDVEINAEELRQQASSGDRPQAACPDCRGSNYYRIPGTLHWRCRRCRPTGRTQIETHDVIQVKP